MSGAIVVGGISVGATRGDGESTELAVLHQPAPRDEIHLVAVRLRLKHRVAREPIAQAAHVDHRNLLITLPSRVPRHEPLQLLYDLRAALALTRNCIIHTRLELAGILLSKADLLKACNGTPLDADGVVTWNNSAENLLSESDLRSLSGGVIYGPDHLVAAEQIVKKTHQSSDFRRAVGYWYRSGLAMEYDLCDVGVRPALLKDEPFIPLADREAGYWEAYKAIEAIVGDVSGRGQRFEARLAERGFNAKDVVEFRELATRGSLAAKIREMEEVRDRSAAHGSRPRARRGKHRSRPVTLRHLLEVSQLARWLILKSALGDL